MLLLGIESSCDDTAASIVRDGREVLSNVISSQDDIHKKYGGIVPELASRRHIETIIPVVEEALSFAEINKKDINAIAVTQCPGLIGSILIGLCFAKAAGYVLKIPVVAVNHIIAHPIAAFLERSEGNPGFPFIAMIVSGGHTSLFKFNGFLDYQLLGETRDDAAGEAFDKVAKLIGYSYPGGRVIDRLAKEGNRNAIPFKRPHIARDSLDFSFSGIKTSVLRIIKNRAGDLSSHDVKDIAASFQEAVVDVLVDKAFLACWKYCVKELVISGGVACNTRLRERLLERGEKEGINVYIPPPELCADNGATIAAYGYHLLKAGKICELSMDAKPRF